MEEIVRIAKAMSDRHRVEIVTLIQREGEVCVCELCDTLRLSQPLVSRHLKQLREAGIVTAKKEGKWMVYRITQTPSKVLATLLDALRENEKILPAIVTCDSRFP